ncbi:argininosuccinate lyase [Kamptonema cortianum]|nr:argininosuccinate lyase [Kamptonema cortianum]MDL5044488.1 argininosuccinate lyase [Oscillatoria amoena NRMC-F 0135]
MWHGRFKQKTADEVRDYTESISYDWRLYPYDIQGSVAHAAMLAEIGVLTAKERDSIIAGLNEIRDEIKAGKFEFKPELEDVHMNIESALIEKIGPAGAKLHTARSRNDQVALDSRLYIRFEVREIQRHLRRLQKALVGLGRQYDKLVMPGYTHLQRAQPVLFAHHLLAYVEMFDRDFNRLQDAMKRINSMPLGSGAIAGSTIALNREMVAKLLDFPEVTRNSMDAVSDRDYFLEVLSDIAIIGVHVSRLCEDIVLWASSEFKFIVLHDAYSTGSSLMPQKKNPDIAELARGKTGRLFGNLMSLLTTMKGLPMTYNRDMQEDKEAVFDSVDTVKAGLNVLAKMIETIYVHESRVKKAVNDAMLLATDMADYLVKKGVPFRNAHEIIGKMVGHCVEESKALTDLTLEEMQKFSVAFEEDVQKMLTLKASITARGATGAPSFKNVDDQLHRWEDSLKREGYND